MTDLGKYIPFFHKPIYLIFVILYHLSEPFYDGQGDLHNIPVSDYYPKKNVLISNTLNIKKKLFLD